MDFEWDEEKAASNLTKHGIAFSVAIRVFGDEDRLEEPDAGDYDDGEPRWKTIGFVRTEEIVILYVDRDDRVRIISARGAETYERRQYWENRQIRAGRRQPPASDR